MLAVEPTGSSRPSLANVLAYVDAAHSTGLNLKLVYLPRWYWSQLGSPDLRPLADRGLHLVSSAYPGGRGTAAQISPGDNAAGWSPYGGMTPTLYQFTDAASEAGQLVDVNAFRGSLADLTAILQTGVPTMGVISPAIGQFWPEIAAQFPANQPFDNDTALIWSDAGARAAALYARQARDAVNALAGRINQPPSS